MKPFDLDAAKRGEPLICVPAGERGDSFPVTLIGMDSLGRVWVEDLSRTVTSFLESQLQMAPMQRTVYVNFFKAGVCEWHYSEAYARGSLNLANLPALLAAAVPVLIEV